VFERGAGKAVEEESGVLRRPEADVEEEDSGGTTEGADDDEDGRIVFTTEEKVFSCDFVL
jgi:hypothetical protein